MLRTQPFATMLSHFFAFTSYFATMFVHLMNSAVCCSTQPFLLRCSKLNHFTIMLSYLIILSVILELMSDIFAIVLSHFMILSTILEIPSDIFTTILNYFIKLLSHSRDSSSQRMTDAGLQGERRLATRSGRRVGWRRLVARSRARERARLTRSVVGQLSPGNELLVYHPR
jgi:hypothetical protein